MRGKVGGLSPPYFKSRGAIAPLAPLLPPPLATVLLKERRTVSFEWYCTIFLPEVFNDLCEQRTKE